MINKELSNQVKVNFQMFLFSLTRLLLRWVETNPNSIIEREVNALAQDEEGFTPLVKNKNKEIHNLINFCDLPNMLF